MSRRQASVTVCVLVVLLLVGLLSVQTLQTLAVIRRSDAERAKYHQANELIEIGRQADWKTAKSKILIQIPDSTGVSAEIEMQTASLERQSNAETPEATSRLVVRFPVGAPGEILTTWEADNGQ